MHEGKYTQQAIENAGLSLKSDHAPSGNGWIPEFEAEFAEFAGGGYGVSVNSATSGLHVALLAAGVQPGDEVISPGLTVVMDAYATIFCGATPVFADVELDTWNLNPASVEALITPKTRAIVTVSWFGLPSNLVALREIADRYGLALIDDSAETMLPRTHQNDAWNLADIRVFSFESKKHFSTGGEGGMVVTKSAELASLCRKYAGIGYRHLGAEKGRTHLAAKEFQNPSYLRFDTVGYNYRMTPLAAAVGLGQLTGVEYFLDSRRRVASMLREAVGSSQLLTPQAAGDYHSYYSFGVRYNEEHGSGASWGDFYDRFVDLGGDGFYSICMNPYLEPSLLGSKTELQEYAQGLCPVAERLQQSVMAFKTNYLDMNRAEKNAGILAKVVAEIEQKQ
jgi:perosamine synthetase